MSYNNEYDGKPRGYKNTSSSEVGNYVVQNLGYDLIKQQEYSKYQESPLYEKEVEKLDSSMNNCTIE